MIKRAVNDWVDEGLRRLARNAGTLIFGNAMHSALGLVSLAMTARALGPTGLGKLVIAVAYASIITQLIGFQSWQAVIRYGAGALARGDSRQFMGVVKAGAALDVAAALVASLVALAGVTFGADLAGIDEESRAVALLVSSAIAVNFVGTPTALLRIFDKYKLFVVQAFVTSLLKLVLVMVAYLAGGALWAFALAWVGSQVFGHLLLAAMGLRELGKRQLAQSDGHTVVETFRRHPDLARFFLFTNLNGTARTLRDLDVPILAWILGPSATGSFKIARQLAGSLNKIIDPFFVAVYPDLARLHSTGKSSAALSLVRRSALSLGAVGSAVLVVFVAVGEPLMVLVLGEAFRSAYPVTAWCFAGAVIWAFAQPISPMLMVYGRHSALFAINMATTLIYLVAVGVAAVSIGVTGVGAVFAAYMLLWTTLTLHLLARTASQDPGQLDAAAPARDA